jgi:hypothetical protein
MELQTSLDYIKGTLVMIKNLYPAAPPAMIDGKGRGISVKCGDCVTLSVDHPSKLGPLLTAHLTSDYKFYISITHDKEVEEVMEYVKGYCDDYRKHKEEITSDLLLFDKKMCELGKLMRELDELKDKIKNNTA